MKKAIIATSGIIICLVLALGGYAWYIQNHIGITQEEASNDKSLAEYYVEGQGLKEQKAEPIRTTFLAVGDISLSRSIAATIAKANDVLVPFRGMESVFKSVDFTFANLETPFSASDTFTAKNTLVFNAPKANVQGLVDYNVKIVNLANNHAFDQGKAGLDITQDWLKEHNIAFMGTGDTLDDAWKPAIIEQNGIKIGFIGASYASVNDGGKGTNDYVARMEDVERLKSAIRNAQSATDFLVVTMHAGTEYTRTPNQGQIDFAHAAIDAGADIVIGAHPHWVQAIEKYCGPGSPPTAGGARGGTDSEHSDISFVNSDRSCKYIFYSLGNFIFDQDWSRDTQEGLTLKIELEKLGSPSPSEGRVGERLQGSRTPATIKHIELLPIVIDNNCCPRPATEIESKTILDKIGVTENIIK